MIMIMIMITIIITITCELCISALAPLLGRTPYVGLQPQLTEMNSLSLWLDWGFCMFQYLVVCSVQLHDNNKSNMISTHVFRILKHYNMMRVQARAQALASLLSSLSASSGFIRVHPLRIHPLSVPWPPRVQVQPSSISYMDNLLCDRFKHTFFLLHAIPADFLHIDIVSNFVFGFCHIHFQAHISTTWIRSHLGVPAKCWVSRRRPPSRQHKCQPQTRHPGDFRGCFGGFDSGQWYSSCDFMGLQRTRWFCWPQLKVDQR